MFSFKNKRFFVVISFINLISLVFALPIYAMTDAEKTAQEAQWQAELEATEKEIMEWQNVLDKSQQGTASLQKDASVLQAKINEAKAFIKKRQVQIEQLTNDINSKVQTVQTLEEKLDEGKESLAAILRSTNEIDSYSIVEVALSNKNISEFFEDVDSYSSIKTSLEEKFNEIRQLQGKTNEEKEALNEQRAKEIDTKTNLETQKKQVESDEAEKQRLIAINKNQEKSYQQVIAEKQAKAAQIRAALFALRDTEGISFGDALTYANEAYKLTGVRPAFVLGILQQESNIGQNVGSCVITDLTSGTTQNINTGTVYTNGIHPTRDLPTLQEILSELGRDPKSTKVSCPLSVGYGGAMGPAQFIPSTWQLYAPRLKQILGTTPDPWNPRHAIIASALLLSDLGAATSEYMAAAKYYAGGNWATYGKSYANSVLTRAQNIQLTMIDPLEGY